MSSLSVHYPRNVVTNADIRMRSPGLVADAERRSMARLWAEPGAGVSRAWAVAMEPHLRDPFRGAIEPTCGSTSVSGVAGFALGVK